VTGIHENGGKNSTSTTKKENPAARDEKPLQHLILNGRKRKRLGLLMIFKLVF